MNFSPLLPDVLPDALSQDRRRWSQQEEREDWRYTDPAIFALVSPVQREHLIVPAGQKDALTLIEDSDTKATGNSIRARHLVLTLERDSHFALTLLNLGGTYSRILIEAHLAENAHLDIGAVQIARQGETLETITSINHAEPNATSRQTIRSVVADGGTVTCLGRICVARGADGADADQSVRAMLLGSGAVANARPELEIFADDVRCSHGCAVGELDAMGLFYLAARGLAPAQARALMLQAFVGQALDGTADRERLEDMVISRLALMGDEV